MFYRAAVQLIIQLDELSHEGAVITCKICLITFGLVKEVFYFYNIEAIYSVV